VSHDLKNPIQVIQLGVALIEMDGPLNELQLDRVMIVQRSTEQLRNLVANVLDLARLEAGPSLRPETLHLSNVAAAALAEIEHLATRKQQHLISDIVPNLPMLRGDAALLQRAIANLLSNAIKYTPQGGQITLQLTHHDAQIAIAVIDTGEGIPAEALPQLFTRFYRVPGTSAEGTGLGLSIVKSIVEKHDGKITVESTTGQGSTFTITLPLPAQAT
ncbi:MAG: HAMP domain-containing histidine kinase, partial [Anaerolineae bacterium]|nr:HAMP domain-containing histidine kinase [Anaerolineae bacterium]